MNNSQPLSIITYFNYTCIHTHTWSACLCRYAHMPMFTDVRRQLRTQFPSPLLLLPCFMLWLGWLRNAGPVLLSYFPPCCYRCRLMCPAFYMGSRGQLQRTHTHGWCFYLGKTQCTFYWILQNKFLGEQDHKPSLYIAYSKMEGLVITDKVIINQIFS